ncbi:uncharacterized protein FPRO_12911 [Fusarium proliferatum ET1]|uniref:Uncharacterized protein n=1 Tax=Fusarium proliferatum (strain ET1) TaxID=1227346 RepID=A0A1L7W7C7_FUSPR|nr:uncharacterized protein FPRO_12911 [Fusarium proliferatum ET1]CZR48301.1 uncharacterized protein FPRO_12911 [Fusarium proliferatum ET1]
MSAPQKGQLNPFNLPSQRKGRLGTYTIVQVPKLQTSAVYFLSATTRLLSSQVNMKVTNFKTTKYKHPHQDHQTSRPSNIKTIKHQDHQTSRPSNIKTIKHQDHQTSRPSNIKTIKHQDHQTSRPSNIKTIKHQDHQTSRPSNIKTIKHQDHQTSRPSNIKTIKHQDHHQCHQQDQ